MNSSINSTLNGISHYSTAKGDNTRKGKNLGNRDAPITYAFNGITVAKVNADSLSLSQVEQGTQQYKQHINEQPPR